MKSFPKKRKDLYQGFFEDSPVPLWLEDLSGLKRELENLKESGVTDFPLFFEQNPEQLNRCASAIRVLKANRAALLLYEAKTEKDLNHNLDEIIKTEARRNFIKEFSMVAAGAFKFEDERVNYTTTGKKIYIKLTWGAAIGYQNDLSRIFVSAIDITAQKQIEEALKESQARYRNLFDNSPIPLWEEDLSEIKKILDNLRQEGVKDLAIYLDQHPQVISQCMDAVRTLDYNIAYQKLFHADDKQQLLHNVVQTITHPNVLSYFKKDLVGIFSGHTQFEAEYENFWICGEYKNVLYKWSVAPGAETTYARCFLSILDITEHKQSEIVLRENQARYHSLFENSPISLWEEDFSGVKQRIDELRNSGVTDIEEYMESHPDWILKSLYSVKALDINQATLSMLGASSKKEVLQKFPILMAQDAMDVYKREILAIWQNKLKFETESHGRKNNGEHINLYTIWSVPPGYEDTYAKVFVSISDITESKRTEEALRESQMRYHGLFEDSPICLWEEDWSGVKEKIEQQHQSGISVEDFPVFIYADSKLSFDIFRYIRINDVNRAALKMYHAKNKMELLSNLDIIFRDPDQTLNKGILLAINGGKTEFESEGLNYTLDGEKINIRLKWLVQPGYEKTYSKVLVSVIDITESKKAEQSLKNRLDLEALIAGISNRFIRVVPATLEREINLALQTLGEFIHVDRCTLYLLRDEKTIQQVYCWNAPGISGHLPELNTNIDILKWSAKKFRQGQYVAFDNIKDIPHEARQEKRYWSKEKVLSALTLPILSGKELTGLIEFRLYRQPRHWEETDIYLLKISSEIFLNTFQRLKAETEKESLRQATATLTTSVELDKVLSEILKQLKCVIPYDDAAIHLREGNFCRVVSRPALEEQQPILGYQISINTPIVHQMYKSKQPVIIYDIRNNPKLQFYNHNKNIRGWMGVPLIWQSEFIGFLSVDSKKINAYGQRDASLAQDFANQAAIALTNARLFNDIRTSAQEWAATFDSISDMIVLTDSENRIVRCNQALLDQLETSFNQIIGKTLGEVISGGNKSISLPIVWNGDVQLPIGQASPGKKALTGWFEISSFPIQSSQAASGMIYIIKDISERKKILESMIQSQKMAGLGTLAAGIAHEMNTPLQIITGISETLINKLESGLLDLDAANHKLEIINQNAWRLANIVRSLRIYTYGEATKFELHSLSTLVEDTLLLIEYQLKNWSNIIIETRLDSKLPPIFCDRNKISQVLINLITNARDAMPHGGKIIIQTAHQPDKKNIVLQVSDTGKGIPPEIQSKIFDPFFTTKAVGSGVGLGLSIVLGTIKAHGGEIKVNSIPDRGTTFTLTFPEKPVLPQEITGDQGRY